MYKKASTMVPPTAKIHQRLTKSMIPTKLLQSSLIRLGRKSNKGDQLPSPLPT